MSFSFHIVEQFKCSVQFLFVPLVHVVESVPYAVLLLGCSARQLHGAIGHVYLQCLTMRYLSHVEILDDVLRVQLVEHVEQVFFVHMQYHFSVLPLVVRRFRLYLHHVHDASVVQCQFRHFLSRFWFPAP